MVQKMQGYYTGDIAIPPYLTQSEVQEDCIAGVIPDVFRKGENGYNIIHRRHVEAYYESKKLPPIVIAEKLKKLGIVPVAQAVSESSFRV